VSFIVHDLIELDLEIFIPDYLEELRTKMSSSLDLPLIFIGRLCYMKG
jgi:hypothetical protein